MKKRREKEYEKYDKNLFKFMSYKIWHENLIFSKFVAVLIQYKTFTLLYNVNLSINSIQYICFMKQLKALLYN